MDKKELYEQQKQAQLDEWEAELQKLKARAAEASAEEQLKLNQEIEMLQGKIEDGRTKLTEVVNASDEAWESIRDGVESAFDSMKSAFREAADKFKE